MKKFKDCSKEELEKYCNTNLSCDTCKLYFNDGTRLCHLLVAHKDLLSDKVLNIELPIEDKILDDTEKKFLTQVVKFYDKIHCKVISFVKCRYGERYILSFGYIDKNKSSFVSNLPFFENKEMYKNMKLDEPYTLEELGINAPKHKITIDEFFKSKENLAIHPGNLENANILCRAFDDKKYKWSYKEKYIKNNNYNRYGDETCYDNEGGYCNIDFYKCNRCTIIEFEDVDLEN